MSVNVLTHLMFEGNAEEAMRLYVSLVPDSKILSMEHYTEGENSGKLQTGRFELGGKQFICIDSPIKHDFSFTPAMSIFVEFQSRPGLENCFNQLSEDGTVMMPLDNYGFSDLFGWVSDRYGVSWQLNLTE